MEILLRFISDVFNVLVWPVFFLVIIKKRALVTEMIIYIVKELGIKDYEFSIFGQKVKGSIGDLKKKADEIERQIEMLLPAENISDAIPYVSFQELEDVVYKIRALEVFGIDVDKMENIKILNCLGGYYYVGSEFERAKKVYKFGLGLFHDNARLHSHLGWTYLRTGDYKNASDSFYTAIKYEASLPWAYLGFGKAEFALSGRSQKQKEYFEKAIEGFKKHSDTGISRYLSHCGLGNTNLVLGSIYKNYNDTEVAKNNYNTAKEEFDKAIEIESKSALAYYNRSIAKINITILSRPYVHKEDCWEDACWEDACWDFVRALLLNPELIKYARIDDDFRPLRNHRCYKCLVEREVCSEEHMMGKCSK